RTLMDSAPVFREAIDRCDQAMQREAGWRLCDELMADEATSRLEEVDVVQRVIFAMQIALAAQWRAMGGQPAAVVGHSLGEIAAAHLAGILDLDSAVRVICARSRLVKEHASESGGLLAAEMTVEQAERAAAMYHGKVVVGVVNGPTGIAFSG